MDNDFQAIIEAVCRAGQFGRRACSGPTTWPQRIADSTPLSVHAADIAEQSSRDRRHVRAYRQQAVELRPRACRRVSAWPSVRNCVQRGAFAAVRSNGQLLATSLLRRGIDTGWQRCEKADCAQAVSLLPRRSARCVPSWSRPSPSTASRSAIGLSAISLQLRSRRTPAACALFVLDRPRIPSRTLRHRESPVRQRLRP